MAIAETAIVKYFQHVNMRYKTFDSEMKNYLLRGLKVNQAIC